MLTEKDLKALLIIASKAAINAGEYIQSQFDQHYDTGQKQGGDSLASQVVTSVDFHAQCIILKALESTFLPYNLGLLTEEAVDDQSRHNKPYFWCVDPLDGTLPFTEGRTGYAVSIALVSKQGEPLIGVVYVPDLQRCYTAIKGQGLQLNDKAFMPRTSDDHILHVYMDNSLKADPNFESILAQMESFAKSSYKAAMQQHMGYGAVRNSIGVMHSLLGCYFKIPQETKGGGSIWDFAATRLFFEELGIHVSNAAGKRLDLNNVKSTFMNKQGIIYSTDLALHEHLIS